MFSTFVKIVLTFFDVAISKNWILPSRPQLQSSKLFTGEKARPVHWAVWANNSAFLELDINLYKWEKDTYAWFASQMMILPSSKPEAITEVFTAENFMQVICYKSTINYSNLTFESEKETRVLLFSFIPTTVIDPSTDADASS